MSEQILKTEDRQPCEIWTRVMGYHRPVSQMNVGKKREWKERQYLSEPGTKKQAAE